MLSKYYALKGSGESLPDIAHLQKKIVHLWFLYFICMEYFVPIIFSKLVPEIKAFYTQVVGRTSNKVIIWVFRCFHFVVRNPKREAKLKWKTLDMTQYHIAGRQRFVQKPRKILTRTR